MDRAGVTGELPKCLCDMVLLQYFMASYNRLVGHIPSCVGKMVSLRDMRLKCNQISGTVPADFTALTPMTELSVNCNLNLNCASGLATRLGFQYLCGDVYCLDCPQISSCPGCIVIPRCGSYCLV